ncbi:MAG: hypothetical protein IIW10_00015 [Spirochaetaceae bacterium]|nr:hypothetical protein [Spirochaetaceae bacterium]
MALGVLNERSHFVLHHGDFVGERTIRKIRIVAHRFCAVGCSQLTDTFFVASRRFCGKTNYSKNSNSSSLESSA